MDGNRSAVCGKGFGVFHRDDTALKPHLDGLFDTRLESEEPPRISPLRPTSPMTAVL